MIQTATNVFPDDEVLELDWTVNSDGNKILKTPITGKVNCRGSVIKNIDLRIKDLTTGHGDFTNAYQINYCNLKHGDIFSIKPCLDYFDDNRYQGKFFQTTDDYEYTLVYHGYKPENTDEPNYDNFICRGKVRSIESHTAPVKLKIGKNIKLYRSFQDYYGVIKINLEVHSSNQQGICTCYITGYNSSTGDITITPKEDDSNFGYLVSGSLVQGKQYSIYTNYFVDKPRVFRLREKPDVEVNGSIVNNKTGIKLTGTYRNFSKTGLLAYKFKINEADIQYTEIYKNLPISLNNDSSYLEIKQIPIAKKTENKVMSLTGKTIQITDVKSTQMLKNASGKYIYKITEYTSSQFTTPLNNTLTEISSNDSSIGSIEDSNKFYYDASTNQIIFLGNTNTNRYFKIEYFAFDFLLTSEDDIPTVFIKFGESNWYGDGVPLYLLNGISNLSCENYYYKLDIGNNPILRVSCYSTPFRPLFRYDIEKILTINNTCSLCFTTTESGFKSKKQRIETNWFYDDNLLYTDLNVPYNQYLICFMDLITRDNKIYSSEKNNENYNFKNYINPQYLCPPVKIENISPWYSLNTDYSNKFDILNIRSTIKSKGSTCTYYRAKKYNNDDNIVNELLYNIEDLNNSKFLGGFTNLTDMYSVNFIDFEPAGNQNYIYFFIFNDYKCAVIDVNMKEQDGWYIYSLKQSETSEKIYKPTEHWNFNCNILNTEIITNIGATVNNAISEKPIITYSDANYESGSFSAMLETINCPTMTFENNYKRIEAWKKFISQDCNFLLKSDKGDSWIVNITETPTRSYDHSFDVQPTTINYSWVESLDIQKVAIIGHKSTD